jgi:DNA recombination protein RmuC
MSIYIFSIVASFFGGLALGYVIGIAKGFSKILQERNTTAQIKGEFSSYEKQVRQLNEDLFKVREELKASEQNKIIAETKMEGMHHHLEEEKKNLDEARKNLKDSFAALSKDALYSNNEMFLKLAKSSLEKVVTEAQGHLEKKEESISGMVKPIQETLKRYEVQTRQMEENRQKAYGTLEEQLRALLESNHNLKQETGHLVSALKKPQVRGRWGEMTLKRVAELAGMVEHCDFSEQTHINTEEGALRPDMLVNLPDGRCIVIDSKVPLQAYLESLEAQTEEKKDSYLKQHCQHVMTHIRQLSKKAYWDQFENTPDFVVMFIPGESFLSVAVEYKKNLIEEAIHQNVIVSSPTTLIALLRAVAYGWRQEKLAQNAKEISRLGAELYERIAKFVEHYGKVGKALERATDSFNQSVGSLESRVLVSVRKFKEMGVSSKSNVDIVEQIEKIPKLLDQESVE